MTRVLYLVFLINLLSLSSGFAQKAPLSSTNKKALSYYQAGVNNSRRFQYEQAVENFQNALKKDSNFLEAYFALGSVYKKAKKYGEAITSYEQGIATAPSQDKILKYYALIGETYFAVRKYKEASGYILSYLENNSSIDIKKKKNLLLLLKKSEFAKEAIKNPVEFNPKLVSGNVNRFPVQYFPVLTADETQLIYTARRKISPGFDEDIYIATKDSVGNWNKSKLISPNISRQGINEGACSISADGRVLVFTICKDRRGLGSCDLYISYKIGDNWSYPKNLKAPVNSSKWESQPSLTADGKGLYFVSDRSGGYGGLDIWFTSQNKKGEWSKPTNLGENINTEFMDITPFIHANNKSLYFSSEGHPGFGGYDLFSSTKINDTWVKPTNMGYPLNNLQDQISLFVTPDGSKGFFSHEEEEKFVFKSEIYEFILPEKDRVKTKSIYLSGKVTDKETGENLGAQIEIFNQESTEEIFQIKSDSVNGNYLIVLNEGGEYGMYISKEGYLFKELDIDLKKSEKTLSYDTVNIQLEKVKKGVKTTLKNIFFDFDKYELKDRSIPELEVFVNFLRRNSEIKVEIVGHTDNNGGISYNLDLSDKRAKAVYDYISNKGIDMSRLLYSGKGSEYPIDTNKTEDGRSKNRRIEFIIR